MSYERIIASLNPQMRGGDNDRVGMLRRVLAKLNHPERQYRIIHIAGTNGKGSTGSLIVNFFAGCEFKSRSFQQSRDG